MSSAPGLHIVPTSPACLTQAATRWIAESHRPAVSDLTALTVLVPRLHARATFARALSHVVARPVVLLPRITTLRDWAASMTIDVSVLTPVAREAMLYRALAERRWLAEPDLWAIAAELGALFDELTRWQVGLPRGSDDFVRAIDRAYRARAGTTFGFEARMVYELWHAMAQGAGLDSERAYQAQLARLVQKVDAPLFVVGLDRLTPAELAFLERAAERVAVTWFQAAADDAHGNAPVLATLAAAWPATSTSSMHVRASALRSRVEVSPLAPRLRFFGAVSAEQEARAVDVSVRRWLAQGCRDIAIVVLDRVSGRRARALLERAEILVRDEAGWAFSTTSAATIIGRWFDAIAGDFHHRDLLDVLKSPFAFHDQPRSERQDVVWRFERVLRAANARSGLTRFRTLVAQRPDDRLGAMLVRVERAERALAPRRRKTLVAWIAALSASLEEIGVHAGLAADLAGAQLLQLFDQLTRELASDRLTLSLGDFRRWLARTLETTTFRDTSIDSPVVFTSLDAMRLRRFGAVLLLGADADHLPGPEAGRLIFNQGVRRELGLPGRAEQVREIEEQLIETLSAHDDVLVTWQAHRDGEENLLSPVLDRLRALHGLAWETGLDDVGLADLTAAGGLVSARSAPLPAPTIIPKPHADGATIPTEISPSGYNVLMECPYRFHARYVLGLRELDEVQEEVRKADYGLRVHEVLARFHRAVPSISALAPADAMRTLDEWSIAAFQEDVATNYMASAWLARWRALIPQYLDWQRAREAEGWHFSAAEIDRGVEIETPAGRTLKLHGRIDRIDIGPAQAVAVLDYKTQSAAGLRAKVKMPGEDVQLPAYALMWGGEVAAALFVSLDRDVVASIGSGVDDVAAFGQEIGARLARLYDAVADGAPLPAQGTPDACRYCEMHGLCRRKHWP